MVMTCIYVGFRLFCEGVKRIHHPPVINDPAWVLATSFGGLAINLIGIFGFRCGMYIYVCVCVCVYMCIHAPRTHAHTHRHCYCGAVLDFSATWALHTD